MLLKCENNRICKIICCIWFNFIMPLIPISLSHFSDNLVKTLNGIKLSVLEKTDNLEVSKSNETFCEHVARFV